VGDSVAMAMRAVSQARPVTLSRIDALALLRARDVITPSQDVEITRLKGGYWNDVVRVQGDGFDWVAKIFAVQTGWRLFPILPDEEARALLLLRGQGIAPEYVEYHPRVRELPAVLIYEWVEGREWETGTTQVAHLFRRQHAVPAEGFREVPTGSVGIVEQGERLLHDADSRDAAALRRLRPAGRVQPSPRRSLLHTDAGTGNFIVGPQGIRLIDWQCPALGDAAEDLFTFLSPAFQVLYGHEPLTPAERAEFLAAYEAPQVLARLTALEPALTYRFGAYCAMRRLELEQSDPAGSARYARALALSIADLEAFR
ncbi:MAG: phosphotransferase family protein, partial [Gaiellales bacterium]